jgi:V8-like Glu-specific endopeptidase
MARKLTRSSRGSSAIDPGRVPVSTGRQPGEASVRALHERVSGGTFQTETVVAESPIGAKALFPRRVTEAVEALTAFDESKAVEAGLLSYGGPLAARLARLEAKVQPEVVFGEDNRVQIQNTTDYPYRCLCYLKIWLNGGWLAFGTGWIIGKRTVITAGHCVFVNPEPGSRVPRGWARQVEVVPGRNGQNPPPFGSFTVRTANLHSTRGWTQGQTREEREQADYGAIIVNEDFPADHGTFGFAVHSDAELHGLNFNIVGYPGEYKQPPLQATMWGDSGVLGTPTPQRLLYTIDTTPGESGAAVFYIRPQEGDAVAAGIHNYGVEHVSNYASRITDPVRDNLRAWRDQGGG